MTLASVKVEVVIAAETLKTKIDLLKRLDTNVFDELNQSIYEMTDLYLSDAINILPVLTFCLTQP